MVFPDPAIDLDRTAATGKQTAVLAGGCFWCVEAVFDQLNGVKKVMSGFAGGDAASANYELVSAGKTNHAESVEITYDPAKVSYGTLLKIFFSVAHDPTQLNRQGPDWGSQYRSVVFTHSGEQAQQARAKIAELNAAGAYRKTIVTKVEAATRFWRAEEYHQRYLEKRGMVHCHI